MLSSRVIVSLAQVAFLAAIGIVFFDAKITYNVIPIIALSVLGSGIFLLVGLLISMLADTYEAAAPITTAIGLPLTFLGNIFFPTDSLPAVLKAVSEFLPITYLADGLRKMFLENASWGAIGTDLAVLAVWFMAILGITLWRFKFTE
jgi:ABC-type multidrug transport system permease subunit